MSRIGNKLIKIPDSVKVEVKGQNVKVQGARGKLELDVHPRINVAVKDKEVAVKRPTDQRTDRALHGLTRSLIQNMITGSSEGYVKELEIVGVGYKAQVKGRVLNLLLGHTHPIDYDLPEGIEAKCPNPTRVVISGCDKQKVGQVAADIRLFRKPEPYKGKGIHYVGEVIRRKQGKTVG
ncbi:MAG: 50S ribosomal protein L6 [Candidatus Omnitrophota bacterium]|nr:50S ribosomal protein L6 [Candidatus Omnitrophota bacterium]